MPNRPAFAGAATVEVNQTRYEDLLHKEALLDLVLSNYKIDLFMSTKPKEEKGGEINDS